MLIVCIACFMGCQSRDSCERVREYQELLSKEPECQNVRVMGLVNFRSSSSMIQTNEQRWILSGTVTSETAWKQLLVELRKRNLVKHVVFDVAIPTDVTNQVPKVTLAELFQSRDSTRFSSTVRKGEPSYLDLTKCIAWTVSEESTFSKDIIIEVKKSLLSGDSSVEFRSGNSAVVIWDNIEPSITTGKAATLLTYPLETTKSTHACFTLRDKRFDRKCTMNVRMYMDGLDVKVDIKAVDGGD
jgi:hypothetical protein